MSLALGEFEQYKLSGFEYAKGCWEHTIVDENEIRKERWSRGRRLGSGGFGTVWLEKEEGGALRAVKQISRIHFPDTKELLALTRLKAYPQYFVQFFGWFENDENIYLAMENIECGDLGKYIWGDQIGIPESEAKTITAQILAGLKVMHDNHFCHRDLKPQNILMVSLSPPVVKISDFGVSKQVLPGEETAFRTTTGTQGYTAPEILGLLSSNSSIYTNAVDIWSLGCLVHAILTRGTPFKSQLNLLDYIQSRISFPTAKLTEVGASPIAIEFITKLIMPHPNHRLSAERALKHSWLGLEGRSGSDGRDWEEDVFSTSSFCSAVSTMLDPPKSTPVENESPSLFWAQTSGITIPSVSGLSQGSVASKVSYSTTTTHECITLYCAVRHQNLTTLRRLLNLRRSANPRPIGNTTLLHRSADTGNEEIMRLLIENGADVLVKDREQRTVLHLVAEKGYRGMAELLLKAGAELMAQDRDHKTALHLAAVNGHEAVAKFLLDSGADIDATDINGDTVLHLASRNGHLRMAALLLENMAEITVEDGDGCTALGLAAVNGHGEILRFLLDNGADIGETNRNGNGLLHLVALNGNEEAATFLLEKGADITAKNVDGYTALHTAVEAGHEKMVILLIGNGADIELTTLEKAFSEGNEEILDVIFDQGVYVHFHYGSSEKIVPVNRKNKKYIEGLITTGAPFVGKGGHGGKIPFRVAIETDQKKIKKISKNGFKLVNFVNDVVLGTLR